MKKWNGYEETKTLTQQERLPVGAYVLKILKAEELTYSWGNVLLLSFDIAEGEYKDFYADNYRNQQQEDKKWKGTFRINVPKDDNSEQDAWTKTRFKTCMAAIEESNKNYSWDWDETKLKGKLVGALFNNKEYDYNGKTGFFTNCHSLISAENVRNGNFKIPKDTLLKNSNSTINSNDYEDLDDEDQEDLPF